MTRMQCKQNLKQMFLCLVAAYVALLPQFYLVYDQGNRYALDWSPLYRTSILLSIGILAAAYGLGIFVLWLIARGLNQLQRRVDCRRLVFDFAVWVLTILALRSLMAIAYSSEEMPAMVARIVDLRTVKIFCYVILPAGSLLFFRERYAQAVLTLYRLLSVLFIFFLVQLFTWEYYAEAATAEDIPSELSGPEEANSLYIFLFDEWSFEDSFGHPDFSITNMPVMEQFLGESILFSDAYSPAACTTVSIPRFLCQTDSRMASYSYAEVFNRVEGNQFLPLKLSSIYDISPGHFGLISGTYLHYSGIVGTGVDCLIPFDDKNARYSMKERVSTLLYSQVGFLRKLGLATSFIAHSSFELQGWEFIAMENQSRIRPVLNEILPRLPYRNVAFFHMYLPHPPYLFNRDWSPHEPLIFGDPGDPHLYLENIYAMDAVLGDIIKILKERGDYDSSMIVLLSDHSWKFQYSGTWEELDIPAYLPEKHVPLIIKYPGQTRGGHTDQRILLTELHPLFSDYLTIPQKVEQWVAQWNAGSESQVYLPKRE